MPVLRAFSEGGGVSGGDASDGGGDVSEGAAADDGPTLLLVSAGFDAALGDLQGGMSLSPGGFAWMMRQLLALPRCQPVVVFEGGYHLQARSREI